MGAWKNRIVETGEESPENLLANPMNFRRHPKHQQDALKGVLNEVGWVQDVIVNQRTGHLIDGHLRVELALRNNVASIPVTYVDLTDDEERLILATFDPLSAMAFTDKHTLEELLREVSTGDAAIQSMLAELAEREGIAMPDANTDSIEPQMSGMVYQIVVSCNGEAHQRDLLEQFEAEGLQCRALIS